LWAGDITSPLQRRRRAGVRRDHGRPEGDQRGSATHFPCPSSRALPADEHARRQRRLTISSRRTSRVPAVHSHGARGDAGHHGFRRRPGGNHLPGSAMPHRAGKHRATGHDDSGDEHPGRSRHGPLAVRGGPDPLGQRQTGAGSAALGRAGGRAYRRGDRPRMQGRPGSSARKMKLTFIVTIDGIKNMALLNALVHSLNLQTSQAFNVVFYNQTLMDDDAIFEGLRIRPSFEYRVYRIDRKQFFGRYPVWDLYEFHNALLDADVLSEYFMSLHMEEFFDVDYVENALNVLRERHFDIMFGNLSETRLDHETIEPLLRTTTAGAFRRCIEQQGLQRSLHWSFGSRRPFASRNVRSLAHEMLHLYLFRFRRNVRPTRKGYRRLATYMAEDLYFMKREFARRHNWFLRGHHMYFEDIHICE